jgi:hypothetical protein
MPWEATSDLTCRTATQSHCSEPEIQEGHATFCNRQMPTSPCQHCHPSYHHPPSSIEFHGTVHPMSGCCWRWCLCKYAVKIEHIASNMAHSYWSERKTQLWILFTAKARGLGTTVLQIVSMKCALTGNDAAVAMARLKQAPHCQRQGWS